MPRHLTRPLTLRRRLLFIALTGLLVALLALAGSELLVRVLWPMRNPNMHPWPRGYLVPDAATGYTLARNFPRTWMTHVDGKTRNLCYTNAQGMRDVAIPPPDGRALRILAVGCSQTEGMGILDPGQPWPRQLQRELNYRATSDSAPVVIMNGGVAGYNCFQMIRRAEALHDATRPAVWLMGYYQVMWTRNTYGPAGQYAMHWGVIFDRENLEQLFAGRSVPSRWGMDHSLFWRWFVLQTTHIDFDKLSVARPYPDPAAATREALRQFKEAARRHGAIPLVAYLPSLHGLDELTWQPTEGVAAELAKICRECGLTLLDPTPRLLLARWSFPPGQTFYRRWALTERDPHYNPAGNAAYADALAPLLAPSLSLVRASGH